MRLFLFATTLLLGGCVLRASPATSNESCGSAVDPTRELEIVDDDTLVRLSQNAEDGPLSFRHVVETLTGNEVPAATFIEAWMRALGADVECDVREAWASHGPLDLARAPWRLIAVANRMDLAGKPGLGPVREGRLVFGLTEGPADDPASAPRETTLIVEFALPTTRTETEWAHAWHALGENPLGNVAYDEALARTVASFAARASLSQVRWNDPVHGLRQLDLDARGMLVVAPLRNTPPAHSIGRASSRRSRARTPTRSQVTTTCSPPSCSRPRRTPTRAHGRSPMSRTTCATPLPSEPAAVATPTTRSTAVSTCPLCDTAERSSHLCWSKISRDVLIFCGGQCATRGHAKRQHDISCSLEPSPPSPSAAFTA